MSLSPEEMIITQHLLMDDEGLRLFPYLDCCGKPWRDCGCERKGYLTIGIGRNLDTVGISEPEAMALQTNDIKKITAQIEQTFPWFKTLKTPRRIVILSMVFNLGIDGFKKFKKLIKSIELQDFRSASTEMLQSQWATQVKGRAKRLASIMDTGQF